MKKNYFYLAAATFLLAGCAQDSFVDENLQETTVPQEIKLSAGNRGISVGGRGAGTVGDLSDQTSTSTNVWSGQKLTIHCFNRNNADMTTEDVYLNGVEATATATTNSNETIISFSEPKYYPIQGAFHFTGYYIDDAKDNEVITTTTDKIETTFTIDGTQDVMIADDDLSYAQISTLVSALITSGKLTGNVTDYLDEDEEGFWNASITSANKTLIENEIKKTFSSYTARRGVQPNMVFKHQLARLRFFVIAGDKNAKYNGPQSIQVNQTNITKPTGVLIESIKLLNPKNKGTITIKNTGEISFAPAVETAESFTLKKRADGASMLDPLVPLTEVTTNGSLEDANPVYTQIGESILAFPEDYYTVDITTKQYLKSEDGVNYSLVTDAEGKQTPYNNVKIQLLENGNPVAFKAGYSYDIMIKIYSNQEISIKAILTGWEDGGDVEVSPEDQIFDQTINNGSNN